LELLPYTKFTILKQDLYAFYNPPSEDSPEMVRIYSTAEKSILKKLGKHARIIGKWDSTEPNPFYQWNGEYFFTCRYPNNELYKIDPETFELNKIVRYDFGKYTFTLDALYDTEAQNRNFIMNHRDKYVFVSNKYENREYYITFTFCKDDMYIIRYHKETGTQEIISWKFSDDGMLLPPIFIDNDFLYIITDHLSLLEVVNHQLLSSNAKEILNQLKEDDNPVIIKCKFQNVK
jgi:hypothetical protein